MTQGPSDRAKLWPNPPADLYSGTPAWDIGRPQPVFAALADAGELSGRVLDIGCGTGEHTLLAAGLGLDATGIDMAADALEVARRKAADRGLSARFRRHDARRLAELGEVFDIVLDCGLFHIVAETDRAEFVTSVHAALRSGGRYFLLAFSDLQPGTVGPYRLTRTDITSAFGDGWRIDTIEPATIDVNTTPNGARAWFVALTSVDGRPVA